MFKTKKRIKRESEEMELQFLKKRLNSIYVALSTCTDVDLREQYFEECEIIRKDIEFRTNTMVARNKFSLDPTIVSALISTFGTIVALKMVTKYEEEGNIISPSLKGIPNKLLNK